MITIAGKTTDGKPVVRGVFRVYESLGIPLDVLFEALKSRDMVPDWLALVEDAANAGMKPSHFLAKLEPAITDTYGSEMRDVVLKRCRQPA